MPHGKCCGGKLRSLISRKLGSCPRCIRLSAILALASWMVWGGMYVAWPTSVLQRLGLAVAIGFTAWLAAHVVVFVGKAMAAWETIRPSLPRGTVEAYDLNRRRLLVAALASVGAIILEPLVRFAGHEMVAHADGCTKQITKQAPFTLTCKGTCPDLFDGQGSKVTGACTFVTTARGGKRPGNFECTCVYEPKGATCKVVIVDVGKESEHLDCTGDCPTLFSKAPEKGAKPEDLKKLEVKGECIMIAVPTQGGVEFKCICIY